MANLNNVHCNDTTLRNHQIPFSIVGTASAGGEQPKTFVNGGHHYPCDSFTGHPFPGVHEANLINNQVDMTRKKKLLTSEQVDVLERSFQEEIDLEQQQPAGTTTELKKNRAKLEPGRKVKLSKELGLHPRQVSIWFQNRRAKLKGKQLERLYNLLQKDYKIMSRKNQHLHQEVMELKDKLDSRQSMQDSTGYVEQWSLEKAERNNIAAHQSTWTSAAVQCLNIGKQRRTTNSNTKISGGNGYLFNDEAIGANRDWLTLAPAVHPHSNLQKILHGVPLRPHPK